MTEAEWLGCRRPDLMWRALKGKASARKMRLVSCACCRRVWERLTDERSRTAVEVAERYAEGRAGLEELQTAYWTADSAAMKIVNGIWTGSWEYLPLAACVAANASIDPYFVAKYIVQGASSTWKEKRCETKTQAGLIRDVFGNPFRPVTADPSWLTSTVVSLAESIYAERAFDRLPILADALEDAGCDQPDVLAHCRGDGPHVRGCWVVDLVLGKS